MAFSKRGYRALVLATLKMYLRNPLGPSAVFLFLLVFLAAMRLVNIQQPQSIKMALINQSTSAVTERLVEAIRKVDAFAITQLSEDDAFRKLQQGTLDLVVVF